MKTTTIAILTLFLCACSPKAPVPPSTADQDAFAKTTKLALETKNTKLLNSLFYLEGAIPYQIDESIWAYEQDFKDGATADISFIELSDPSMAPYLQNLTKGTIKNGNLYVPNLTPVIFCQIAYRKGSESGSFTAPVGKDPDGNLKFTGIRKSK